VQLGLGHKKIESTVRHLDIEVDDALAIAEQVNYRGKADRLCPFLIIAKVPHPDLHRQRGCEGQKRCRLRIERLEQRLGLFQIGSVETLGEPAVDRREKVAGFSLAALVAAEPSEARGGAQFPELGPCASAMLMALR
jgi:hypothetical protein